MGLRSVQGDGNQDLSANYAEKHAEPMWGPGKPGGKGGCGEHRGTPRGQGTLQSQPINFLDAGCSPASTAPDMTEKL